MVIEMTNRLLAVVIAVTVSSILAAHAAQASLKPLPSLHLGLRLPTAGAALGAQIPAVVPGSLQTAAVALTGRAQEAVDPRSAVVSAYQRDHDALEHLRQPASELRSPAHAAFNKLLDADQRRLATLERQALDYQSGDAIAAMAAMDRVVQEAQAALSAALSVPAGAAVRPARGQAVKPSSGRPAR